MFDKLAGLEARYEELHSLMGQHAEDYARVAEFARERSELEPVVRKYREYKKIQDGLAQAREMLAETDPEIKAMAEGEAAALSPRLEALEKELKSLLLPRDPRDERNVIVEIRAGTGGDEAGLFAADLFRMCEDPVAGTVQQMREEHLGFEGAGSEMLEFAPSLLERFVDLGGGGKRGVHSSPAVCNRSVSSRWDSSSMKGSISPSSTAVILCSESPTRWSVIRDCGKL